MLGQMLGYLGYCRYSARILCAGVCSTEGAVSMRLGLFCPPRCGAVCAMRWGVGAVLVETR